MKQCFGYVRVSTQKQGEGVSLEAQKDAITCFARNNDLAISDWFEEKETAAKKGRPVFTAMVSQLKRGKADGLVIHKIDRSARNFADWAKIGDLADAGIDVHFASESLDFRSRGGRLSADIQAVIAADYIRNLREECLKGMRGRLKQGLYPWGAPIGYLNNGGGKPKTPDPERAPLIQQMFELYASGSHSLRSLQAEMQQRGLRSTTGAIVTKTGIETILSNPFYCGVIRVSSTGETFAGIHDPLVSPSLFQAVQEIRTGRTVKRINRRNYLFRGLFRCALCGAAMTPELQKGRVYYRCHTKKCPTTTAREDIIDQAIVALLERCQGKEQQLKRFETNFLNWFKQREAPSNPNAAKLRLAQLNQRLERLTDALVDRHVDPDTFTKRKEDILLERARIEEQQRRANETVETACNFRMFLELSKNLAVTYAIAEPEEKRLIVDFATSNRLIDGRKPSLEPRKWLQLLQDAGGVLGGAHHRDTSRTFFDYSEEEAERLFAAANDNDARRLMKRLGRRLRSLGDVDQLSAT